MNSGLNVDDPTVVAAFRAALLHQMLIILAVFAVLSIAWVALRRPSAAGGAGEMSRAVAAEPAGRQVLRIGFGLLWLLDGLLQAQPRMAAGLPSQVIEPTAASSPSWVQHLVNWASTTPRPTAASSATGVARPSTHGHATTRTATAALQAGAAGSPALSQKPSVATATAITHGTNTAAIRSASRCALALVACAWLTSRVICASRVPAPTWVALTTSRPLMFTVAPVTGSPGPTSAGIDSPVTSEASTAELPSAAIPSVPIFSPGRTTNRSPAASSVTGTRRSDPSRRTATVLAPRAASALSASPDRSRARASR